MSFSSSKVPFKSRASVDSHRASDTVESQNPTQYPNKEKIWHDSSPKDEAKKEREIQKLTAELQRMSTEVEAQKEQSKLLKSYVDDAFYEKAQREQEIQDVEQQHEQEIKDINRLHEQEMSDFLRSVLQSKFEALVQQIKKVKTVRNGLPGGSSKDPLEVAVSLVTDDDSRISTNAIDTMQRVQEGVELLEKTQAEIKQSTVGEMLDNLIEIRNATRKRLATSITEFLDHITSLPCDARSGDLVEAKAGILQSSIYGSLVQSRAYQQALFMRLRLLSVVGEFLWSGERPVDDDVQCFPGGH